MSALDRQQVRSFPRSLTNIKSRANRSPDLAILQPRQGPHVKVSKSRSVAGLSGLVPKIQKELVRSKAEDVVGLKSVKSVTGKVPEGLQSPPLRARTAEVPEFFMTLRNPCGTCRERHLECQVPPKGPRCLECIRRDVHCSIPLQYHSPPPQPLPQDDKYNGFISKPILDWNNAEDHILIKGREQGLDWQRIAKMLPKQALPYECYRRHSWLIKNTRSNGDGTRSLNTDRELPPSAYALDGLEHADDPPLSPTDRASRPSTRALNSWTELEREAGLATGERLWISDSGSTTSSDESHHPLPHNIAREVLRPIRKRPQAYMNASNPDSMFNPSFPGARSRVSDFVEPIWDEDMRVLPSNDIVRRTSRGRPANATDASKSFSRARIRKKKSTKVHYLYMHYTISQDATIATDNLNNARLLAVKDGKEFLPVKDRSTLANTSEHLSLPRPFTGSEQPASGVPSTRIESSREHRRETSPTPIFRRREMLPSEWLSSSHGKELTVPERIRYDNARRQFNFIPPKQIMWAPRGRDVDQYLQDGDSQKPLLIRIPTYF